MYSVSLCIVSVLNPPTILMSSLYPYVSTLLRVRISGHGLKMITRLLTFFGSDRVNVTGLILFIVTCCLLLSFADILHDSRNTYFIPENTRMGDGTLLFLPSIN